jgi:hypothetical protein
MPNTEQPDFDEDFEQAVTQWRERHKLREDDAVLLLVELFRIHQRHWDELRRRELPSFEQFRSDITKLSEATKVFHQQSTGLIEALRLQPHLGTGPRVSLSLAAGAALLALAAGFLVGKAWP